MSKKHFWILVLFVILSTGSFADEFQPIPAEVAAQYHFDLKKLFYPNEEAFNKDLAEAGKIAEDAQIYRGKVNSSGKGLLDLVQKLERLSLLTQKLYVYRYLSYAVNTTLEPQLSATDQAISTIQSKV